MKAMNILLIVMLVSLAIAFFWDSIPAVKDTIHTFLDPTAGALLNFDADIGMIVISALITLFITIIQKYTVDNDALRALKKEQKALQEEMKIHKDNKDKLMELQRKQFELLPKTMDLSMRPLVFTGIPIILFFRWFNDYFAAFETPLKIFGLLSWFWAYLILSIIFSMVFRKLFKLP